jgi:hypothetical protein
VPGCGWNGVGPFRSETAVYRAKRGKARENSRDPGAAGCEVDTLQ